MQSMEGNIYLFIFMGVWLTTKRQSSDVNAFSRPQAECETSTEGNKHNDHKPQSQMKNNKHIQFIMSTYGDDEAPGWFGHTWLAFSRNMWVQV